MSFASAGCQVVFGDRDQFLREVTPLFELNQGQLLYTLVEGKNLKG